MMQRFLFGKGTPIFVGILMFLLVLRGCSSTESSPGTAQTGSPNSAAAEREFFCALGSDSNAYIFPPSFDSEPV
jgi:hypothetical protein